MIKTDTVEVTASAPRQQVLTGAGHFHLEIRQPLPVGIEALIIVGAVMIGLALSFAILILSGVPAGDLIVDLTETVSNAQSLHSVFQQMAPLILEGLAAAIAFRVRFWNIGLEGQAIGGAIGATAVAFYHLGPEVLRLPLMIIAAATGGAVWIVTPAILKLRLNVNEIISTLLLNYVAADFLYHLLFGAWRDPRDRFPHTPRFQTSEQFPSFDFGLGADLCLALALVVVLFWLTSVSRIGVYMNFIRANDRMARAVGVPSMAVTTLAVLASGALAGLGGLLLIGQEGRLTENFYAGYGFSGILIAFLARNNSIAIVLVSFLVAILFDAGRTLQVFNQIPFAMVQLIQAIVVMWVAASEFIIRYRVRWIRSAS